MARFKTRLIFSILSIILFTSLSYLTLILLISDDVFQTESIDKLRNIILVSGLAITVLSITIAVLVSFFLTRGITLPLNRLIKATGAIAKKDFQQQVKIRAYREFEELVFSFNNMARQLKDFQEETKRRRRSLEKIAREKVKELSCIYRIGRELSSTLELNKVLDSIVKRTSEVLDLKICTILLVDVPASNSLRVLRVQGVNPKRIEKQTIKLGEGISGWAWDNKEALLIRDIEQDNRFIGRKKEKYYTGSMISVPLEAEGKIIGIINGNNKVNGEPFKEDDLLLLKEIAAESAIAIENALLYKSLKEVYVHTISALASALETKDHYTRSHSENVTRYAVAIAVKMDIPESQVEVIRQACRLHDLGKIGIHDYILTKPGKLSAEEWEEIKLHSLRGAQILEPIDFLTEAANLIRQHHEKFDGTGYPAKLSSHEIHLGARIMAVADAFDAMISARPYREALSLSQTISELKTNSGTQFDPEIVKVFLKMLETEPEFRKLGKLA